MQAFAYARKDTDLGNRSLVAGVPLLSELQHTPSGLGSRLFDVGAYSLNKLSRSPQVYLQTRINQTVHGLAAWPQVRD